MLRLGLQQPYLRARFELVGPGSAVGDQFGSWRDCNGMVGVAGEVNKGLAIGELFSRGFEFGMDVAGISYSTVQCSLKASQEATLSI